MKSFIDMSAAEREVFCVQAAALLESPLPPAVIEKDFALCRGKLPRERPQKRAFSASACAHHADHFSAFHRKGNAIHRHGAVAETANQVAHIERANHIFFLFDEALGEVATQALSDIHADHVAIGEQGGIPDGYAADENRAVRLQNFELAGSFIVVARDFQENVAARTRREKDVILFQQSRVVGNQILAFGRAELEATAVGSGAQSQIAEVEFAIIVKNDFVFEGGDDLAVGVKPRAIQNGIDILECLHAHTQSECDLKAGVARFGFFQRHFILLAHRDENLGQGDVFLRVEVEDEIRVSENHVVHKDALAGVKSGEAAGFQRAALNDQITAAEVFDDDVPF